VGVDMNKKPILFSNINLFFKVNGCKPLPHEKADIIFASSKNLSLAIVQLKDKSWLEFIGYWHNGFFRIIAESKGFNLG
jgi:hypothetical protein